MSQSAVAARYANALADVVTTGASGTTAEATVCHFRGGPLGIIMK